MSESSQCAIMGTSKFAAALKMFSKEPYRSTSILPVDDPMNSFTPGMRQKSISLRLFQLLFVAPKKKL